MAMRARDTDRAVVAAALDNAYADGQLTFEEHRLRSDSASSASTLTELRALGADLQVEVALPPVPLPPSPSRRPMLLGGVVTVAVIALAVVFGVRSADDPRATGVQPLAIVAQPFDYRSAAGLIDFRDRYLARFTDPIVTELYLYPPDNRASLTRVVDGDRTRSVIVSGGFDEPAETTPIAAGSFSLTDIDFAALARLMDDGVTHVIARNTGTPELLVFSADGDGRSGYVQATFAGDVVAEYRP